MIFVNFKTYQKGTGKSALLLAKICLEVEKETGIKIIPVVQVVDINLLKDFNVFTQHVDDISFGPNTGKILPQAIIEAGVKGTLLNHSESKIPFQVIGSTIQKIKALDNNFKVLVCCESIDEAQEIIEFKPDFLAYEPPELIGGDISVSKAEPEVISDFTKMIKEVPILVGAGIRTGDDVKKAIELKAQGILVSSDLLLAEDFKKELLELALAFKK